MSIMTMILIGLVVVLILTRKWGYLLLMLSWFVVCYAYHTNAEFAVAVDALKHKYFG